MGTTQYQYWLIQVSIFGKFPKMPNNMLKYWQIPWPLLKFCLFPSLGTAIHLSVLQFGKFLLFPLNFGSLAVKTMAFFEISSFSPASYIASCVTYSQIQKLILFPHWFGSLAVNAGAIIEILIISHQLSAVWFILSNQVNKI